MSSPISYRNRVIAVTGTLCPTRGPWPGGMSFAIDTEPASTGIRRVVLGHALLSYAFGTGVIAVTINLITNL